MFAKVAKLQSKNPFAFAIVAGDLFADPATSSAEYEDAVFSLLDGKIEVALPTYFSVGRYGLPSNVTKRLDAGQGELCSNLYFLGKRSTTKTSEGIRIVFLGGSLDATVAAGQSQDKFLPFHTEGDARVLHGANSADILITSDWPASITIGSKVSPSFSDSGFHPVEEQCVADLCATLCPRYHFSTSGEAFFEREPFFHKLRDDAPDERLLTRFISLASSNSESKAKWLYAFSLDPKASVPTSLPPGTTASPLNTAQKRVRSDHAPNSEPFARFASNGSSHNVRPHKRRRNQPPPGPGECFFCLSNPNLSTHLIASIASDSYLTTAKGPLTLSSTYPGLQIPCHILLIPLTHAPTLAAAPDPVTQSSTYAELQRYRGALNSMLEAKAAGRLGSVTWEVSRNRGIHFHWQFLPIPVETIEQGLVEAAFRVEAENENYPSLQTRDIGNGVGEGEYFRVWIWQPGKAAAKPNHEEFEDPEDSNEAMDKVNGASVSASKTQLVMPLVPEIRFDIQFGRRVMGKLLGLEKRLDWRDCVEGEEEEKMDANQFKELFKQFDFSLDE